MKPPVITSLVNALIVLETPLDGIVKNVSLVILEIPLFLTADVSSAHQRWSLNNFVKMNFLTDLCIHCNIACYAMLWSVNLKNITLS